MPEYPDHLNQLVVSCYLIPIMWVMLLVHTSLLANKQKSYTIPPPFTFNAPELILGNQIDILCLQEVEVETGYDSALLEFRGYKFSNHFASMLYTITKCQNQLCIIRLKGVWLNLKNMGFCLYILRTLS